MRIVLTGTATRKRRLRAADLPADHNLANSFLRYVDLSGFDLSAYDMRDTDIIDCTTQNVILPDSTYFGLAATEFLISRRTDWTGATMPANTSPYNQDFIIEVLKQAAAALAGRASEIAQAVVEYLVRDYRYGWGDAFWYAVNKLGITPAEAIRDGIVIFQGYPRLDDRVRAYFKRDDINPSPRPLATDLAAYRYRLVSGEETTRDLRTLVASSLTYDRWLLARRLENLVGDGITFWIPEIDPDPIIRHLDADESPEVISRDWDWKPARWGR